MQTIPCLGALGFSDTLRPDTAHLEGDCERVKSGAWDFGKQIHVAAIDFMSRRC